MSYTVQQTSLFYKTEKIKDQKINWLCLFSITVPSHPFQLLSGTSPLNWWLHHQKPFHILVANRCILLNKENTAIEIYKFNNNVVENVKQKGSYHASTGFSRPDAMLSKGELE